MPTISDDGGNLSPTLRPFRKISGEFGSLAVTATSQAVTLTQVIPPAGCPARFVNNGSQVVFFRTDGGAATNATGYPMLPNTVEVFYLNSGDSLTAIAGATGSTLYVTLGQGC